MPRRPGTPCAFFSVRPFPAGFHSCARGILFIGALCLLAGCMAYESPFGSGTSFRQVNLVSDTSAYLSRLTDRHLANAWGLASGPAGEIWVAGNRTGKAIRYDIDGNSRGVPITVPGRENEEMGPPSPVGRASAASGAPTGVVYNGSGGFPMPDRTGSARYLFAGETGLITAWSSGTSARIVIDRSASGAVYKGLALATYQGRDFLYAADFRGRRVDVFDDAFAPDPTKAFVDSTIPADYGPFNIAVIGTELFVAYARLKGPDNRDDSAGLGAGYVNVFGTDGILKRRFLSNERLDSPWGMVSIPGAFGPFEDGIFIGNFGDGVIHVYDPQGHYLGLVQDGSGHPLLIEGLLGLSLAADGGYGSASRLYFTAGPAAGAHGMFGYLVPQ